MRRKITTEIMVEDETMREACAKHYRLSDGSYQGVYTHETIHYKDKEGKLRETDNRLVESKRNPAIQEDFDGFEPVGNEINIKFGDGKSDTLMRMEKDGAVLVVSLPKSKTRRVGCEGIEARIDEKHKHNRMHEDTAARRMRDLKRRFKANGSKFSNEDIELVVPENATGGIAYDNAYEGADIEYIIKNGAVKENIIVKERKDKYEFGFVFRLKNLIAELSGDKRRIRFMRDGKSVYEIPAPNMEDGEGRYSESVHYEMNKTAKQDTIKVKVVADKDWINREESVFPIRIDPTIMYIEENYANWISGGSKRIGENGLNDAWQTGSNEQFCFRLKIDQTGKNYYERKKYNSALLYLPRRSVVSGKTNLYCCEDTTFYEPIRKEYLVCSNIDKRVYSDNINATEDRGYDVFDLTEELEYARLTNSFEEVETPFLSTSYLVKALCIEKESGHTKYVQNPVLVLHYTRANSVEHERFVQDVKRAGIGSIDLFDGSLNFVHTDVSLSGNSLPFNLSRTYNSRNRDWDYTRYGGWVSNLQQWMNAATDSDDQSPSGTFGNLSYNYYGAGGKRIAFVSTPDGAYYEDEMGLGMKYYPAERVIRDNGGNSLHLNEQGYLIRISGPNGTIRINLESGIITGVSDEAGREWTFEYENSRLCKIHNGQSGNDSEEIRYEYTSKNGNPYYLTKVLYYSGGEKTGETNYTYNSVYLTGAKDQTGYGVEYTVSAGVYTDIRTYTQTDRISAGGATTLESDPEGSVVSIASMSGSKQVTENGVKSLYVFDDDGNTICKYKGYITGDIKVPSKVDGSFCGSFTGFESKKENGKQYIKTGVYNTSRYEVGKGNLWKNGNVVLNQTNERKTYSQSIGEALEKNMVLTFFAKAPTYCTRVPSAEKYESEYIESDYSKAPKFGVKVTYKTGSGESKTETAYIEAITGMHQYAQENYRFVAIPLSNVWLKDNITITFDYANNNGTAEFRNIKLEENEGQCIETVREQNIESGEVTQITDNGITKQEIKIKDNRVVSKTVTDLKTGKRTVTGYTATSETVEGFGGREEKEESGTIKGIEYDLEGNYIQSQMKKTSEGNYIEKVWDERYLGYEEDAAHRFRYNVVKDLLIGETYPGGQEINYMYGNNYETKTVTIGGGYNGTTTEKVRKGYTLGLLTTLADGTSVYDFVYDGYGRLVEVSKSEPAEAQAVTIAKRAYRTNCNYATAGSDETKYNYVMTTDAEGNTKKVILDRYGNAIKTYTGANNQDPTTLVSIANIDYENETVVAVDNTGGFTEVMTKTENGNTTYSAIRDVDSYVAEIDSSYSLREDKQLGSKTLRVSTYTRMGIGSPIITGGMDHVTEYTYRRPDNTSADYPESEPVGVEIKEGTTTCLKSTYSDYILGVPGKRRVQSSEEQEVLTEEYTRLYVEDYDNKKKATNFVSRHKITAGNKADEYNYTYDNSGNIKEITRTGNNVKYTYDKASRLIREDNERLNETTLYSYDARGNILSKNKYAYSPSSSVSPESESYITLPATLNTSFAAYQKQVLSGGSEINYTYESNTNKLASYNGISLEAAYDNNGRPNRWITPKAGLNRLIWDRENLGEIRNVNGNDYAYVYDAKGKRIRKTKTGVITPMEIETSKYYYEGEELVYEDRADCKLGYLYDLSGIAGLSYEKGLSKQIYYFTKNLQGDIIGIVDCDGNRVAEYVYDAWGNHKIYGSDGLEISASSITNIGNINPIRYRGYYYDTETGLYYLQSRYYDPKIGRFISQDDVAFLDPYAINGCNLYVYCGNNPVMYIDPTGMAPEWLKDIGRFIGGLAITVVSGAATTATMGLIWIPGLSTIPQLGMTMMVYGGALMASPFNSTIKADMQLIGWNPFNNNADAAVQSQKLSFYKGASVFRHNGRDSMGLLGMVFLHRNSDGLHPNWLRHEYGHVLQGRALGFLLFAGIVGIPSLIAAYQVSQGKRTKEGYDILYFERWADKWGRVDPNVYW